MSPAELPHNRLGTHLIKSGLFTIYIKRQTQVLHIDIIHASIHDTIPQMNVQNLKIIDRETNCFKHLEDSISSFTCMTLGDRCKIRIARLNQCFSAFSDLIRTDGSSTQQGHIKEFETRFTIRDPRVTREVLKYFTPGMPGQHPDEILTRSSGFIEKGIEEGLNIRIVMRDYICHDRFRFIYPIFVLKQVGYNLNIQCAHTASELSWNLFEEVNHCVFRSELIVEIHLVRPYCTIVEKGDVDSDETAVEDRRILGVVTCDKTASHEFTCQLRVEHVINALVEPSSLFGCTLIVCQFGEINTAQHCNITIVLIRLSRQFSRFRVAPLRFIHGLWK